MYIQEQSNELVEDGSYEIVSGIYIRVYNTDREKKLHWYIAFLFHVLTVENKVSFT